MIPPKANADFVAAMEDVLEVYRRPYNPDFPVICMDEQPIQLVGEVRTRIPAKPGTPERYDYEYRRNGSVAGFMFVEPLGCYREMSINERRTSEDWAHKIARLLEEKYPDAQKIILVCDNLNTHKAGSLYATFNPEKALRLSKRLDIHYTPKHGSWLNIAEIELSVFTNQCLAGRRIPDIETLKKEAAKWSTIRNREQVGVDWHFTTKDARIKLKKLYPSVQTN